MNGFRSVLVGRAAHRQRRCATRRRRSCSAAATAGAVGTRPISPTPLMPYGDFGCGTSTSCTSISGTSLARRMPSERSVMFVGKPVAGIGREVLGQRIAEAHVHAALDLALAQQRVDRLADVVDGDDLARCAPLVAIDDRPSASRSRSTEWIVGFGMVGIAELLRPVDDVLALVVDVRRAAGGERGARTPRCTEPAAISVPRDPVVWPKPSSRVVSTITSMRLGIDAELLRRHLQRDGVHALAHLGPAVADLDASVVVDVVEAHDRPAHLAEAVAEAGVLEPEAEPDRLAGGDAPRRSAGLIASRQASAPPAPSSMIWPGPHIVAGADHVALADLPAR